MARQDDWIQLGVKIDPDHLELIDAAVAEMGMTRASFVRSAVLKEARRVLSEEPVTLRDEERERRS